MKQIINEPYTMRPYLIDLGFKECRTKYIFYKIINEETTLYCDYSKKPRKLYAYKNDKTVNINIFKEMRAVEKIERSLVVKETNSYWRKISK